MRHLLSSLLLAASSLLPLHAQDGTEAAFRRWATTPPMGWNSWDCYYSSVNEEITMQNARYMRDHLKAYGWEYVVVDIRWYANHPSLGGGWYNQTKNPDCQLDAFGRYVPSPSRFPSALQDGRNEGFKAMADSIHAMGLKFGIHIMRGLPKYILDAPSKYRLQGAEHITGAKWSEVYASPTPACTWLADNLTVRNNEYGQLYYNSLLNLYAEWGVDFIKVDDLSRPYYADEIAMLRKAIDQCGRPIVLSLSPGKTQYQYADHLLENANMWRMMDDLWDNWSSVKAVFNEAHAWEAITRTGNYADCDMLPLGRIAMTVADPGYASADAGRDTNLSPDEQRLLMTLWGMCHSPLMFGGELTRLDDFTKSLLTNREYLDMHNYAVANRQLYNENGKIAWTSIHPATGEHYLALFRSDAGNGWIYDNAPLYASQVLAYTTDGHQEQVDIALPAGTKTLALVWDDGGDNYNYDHGDWLNPTFISSNGAEVPVTGQFVYQKYTASYFNRINENINVEGTGKMRVLGQTYDRGFAADANALLLLTVPDSIVAFRATAALDDSGIGQPNSTTTMRFYVFDADPRVTVANSAFTAAAHTGRITRANNKPVDIEADVTGATTLTIVIDDCGDGIDYDRADMVNAVLIDDKGQETPLTSLTPKSYTSSWGSLHTGSNVEGGKLVMDGVAYASGLGMNAAGKLIYTLPANSRFVKFKARVGLDDSVIQDNPRTSGSTIQFLVYTDNVKDEVSVDLTALGFTPQQQFAVRDVWAQTDLAGSVSGQLSADVPSHGAKLYRLAPVRTQPGNVTISISPTEPGHWLITANVEGDCDETSYVQFYLDGKPVGAVPVKDGRATYLASQLTDGEHTAQAFSSGSRVSTAARSDLQTFSVSTSIRSVENSASTTERPLQVQVSGAALQVSTRPDTLVSVYRPDGTLVHRLSSQADGTARFTLQRGLYAVATPFASTFVALP